MTMDTASVMSKRIKLVINFLLIFMTDYFQALTKACSEKHQLMES